MSKKIIIDKFGLGNAIVVMEKKKLLEFFLDPPLNAPFYPVNTFLKAKVLRKISQRGGYFVRLPNGKEGFLRSRNDYKEGKIVNIC